ncbi:hypothetical protein DUI87_04937 [Hirundo rustica rustica]|uniref:ribonuclease H n=1 Tax=Hirundo rustica rustica TaxID=333673 RepID=A0A3M0KXU5_HIRRU|nr:hypothetical protein DUI87_04937 [Hirundo rustica rustica]
MESGEAAQLAGSSPAEDAAGPAAAAGQAPPPLPAVSVTVAAGAGVFKFSVNGDTARMRPVFDKSRGAHAVGSSSTAWTLPPRQVTVRPKDRGRFWGEVKAKVEGLSDGADAGAGPAVSGVQPVPSRVPASDPVGPTGQDTAGAAASSEGLQAFPVLQGTTHNTYQPLAWQALAELHDAVKKYGLGSAKLAVRAVERNTTLDPGDPRRMVNTDMLMGTGNYTRAEGQAGYEPLVQEQCQQTGMAALVQTIQLATPQQSFATIVQGVDEPFLCFAGWLMAAVEKQVGDPAERKLMLQSLARSNCNAVCKRIIEALPGEPSMSEMVGACARVTPSSQQMVCRGYGCTASHDYGCPTDGGYGCPTSRAYTVQPAVATVVQPTVATAVQPAVPTAVQPAVAAAVQPAWVVPQGVHQQQWGARARKKQGRKAQKPMAVLFHCARCGRPNHAVDGSESVVTDSDKIHKVPLDAFGPLGDGMSAFLIGRTEDRSQGDSGFGSTGLPQVHWTAVLTKDRPETLCTVSMAGATPSEIHLCGLLDTRADEQLDQGHLEPSTSPWNTPVFCIKKKFGKWRLLQDLRKINAVMEGMGTLQAGMPLPTMLPADWPVVLIVDLKDWFFTIPLHPDDRPKFAITVPTINNAEPTQRYQWKVLPQGMRNSPVLCQCQEPVQGPTVFTDDSGKTGKAIVTWQDGSEWQVLESHEDGSAQLVELKAAVMTFEKFSQEPFNLITDSAYVANITQRLGYSVLKEVSHPALFHLLKALWCAIQARVHPCYILHVRSHTNLPGFVAEGVNPRGLKALELWQTDVTQVAEFGRLKYVHVMVDMFSSAMWASAHTGEKARDVIAHWRQAFAVLGIPSAVKTDNGPAYAPQQASDGEQQPRAKVRVRNLVSKQWEEPYDLIAMGRGYACVSTDTGTRWLPSKCVRPDLQPQRQNLADRQGGSCDQLESHQEDESSSDHSDDSSTDSD